MRIFWGRWTHIYHKIEATKLSSKLTRILGLWSLRSVLFIDRHFIWLSKCKNRTRSVLLIPKLLIQIFIRRKIGYSPLDGRPARSVSAKKLSISDRPFLIRRRRKKTCILKGNRAKIYKSTPFEKRAFPSFALFPVGKCVLYTRF